MAASLSRLLCVAIYAAVCSHPAATITARLPPSACMPSRAGSSSCLRLPYPSCPSLTSPHARTVPSSVKKRNCVVTPAGCHAGLFVGYCFFSAYPSKSSRRDLTCSMSCSCWVPTLTLELCYFLLQCPCSDLILQSQCILQSQW